MTNISPIYCVCLTFFHYVVLQLLEGLQSSLIVSKVPGEKGPRSHFRSTASRGNSFAYLFVSLVRNVK
jgi:hypothetical protein